jgi:hypothetical protein
MKTKDETFNTIDCIAKARDNFISIHPDEFESEKDLQIWLGREFKKLGFDVFLDKNVCELSAFTGDKEKPDILLFYGKNYKYNKQIDFSSPIAIETKFSGTGKFSNISDSILQIKKYYGKKYKAGTWEGEIKNIFLCTDDLIRKDKVYNWAIAGNFYQNDFAFHSGMRWSIIRFLSTISNKAGLLT